jgi:amino acid transporter
MTKNDLLRYALSMHDASPKRQLTLFDSTCIIVGIIIGAGIYELTPAIARNVSSPAMLLGVFALGGFVSLVGALCYAELATTWPREGGEYVFLTRAYGRRVGFLFAWSEFWVVRPGNIAAMAYVFARYAGQLVELPGVNSRMALALAAVLVLTAINALGVRTGKWTQNILTSAKVIGLLAVVAIGLYIGLAGRRPAAGETLPAESGGLYLAMIFVLFTYGGWKEMTYVAAEVREPQRNILRALILGTLAVTVIYLLVNVAFLSALGFQGVRDAGALAANVLEIPLGRVGAVAISILICISSLGAINGMIFTGARIYYALGTEHRLYGWLGKWNETLQTPLRSLLLQGVVTMVLVAFFGMGTRNVERLVEFTTPLFLFFFLLVAISLFVLRVRERDVTRPFRVPLYPLTPIVFCGSIIFMLYATASYARFQYSQIATPWYLHFETMWPLAIMLLGLAASLFDPPLEQNSGRK